MNQKAWGKHGNRSRIKNVVDEYIFLHCNAEFVIRYLTPTFVKRVLDMNIKQASVRASRIQKNNQTLRKQLWGDIEPNKIWNRKESTGYTTLPRTMPIIFQIADNLAEKSKPVSTVYWPDL